MDTVMGDRLVLGMLGVGAVTTTLAVRRAGEPIRAGKRLLPRFRADSEARASLLRETEVLRVLDGRGAPRLVDAGEDALGLYLVMERLAMPTLSARGSPLPTARARWVALASRSVMGALAVVHDADDSAGPLKIVHADLCPDNILVEDDGQSAVLIDFGLARWRGDTGPPPGAFRGTLAYVAPEVARGQIPDARSDLFSLAASLLAVASGERPRQGADFASQLAAAAEVAIDDYAARASRGLPPEIARVLLGCVRFDPSERPATAREALERLVEGQETTGVGVRGAHDRDRAMTPPRGLALDTLCIHAGQEPDPLSGAVMTPIVLASTFAQDGPGMPRGFDYSRAGNPTRAALELCYAAVEGAKHGVAFGSGCAAITTILLTLKSGDHVLSGSDLYGGSFRIFEQVMKPFGLETTFLDMTDPQAVAAAVRPNTRMIWLETPSNPLLKVFDIARIAEVAAEAGVPFVVDNTFATPILQRPLDLGATASLHSATKYLNGHSDVIGGAIMTNDDALAERLYFLQKSVGAVPSPFDCYLVLRGMKTLGVRMRRHVESAEAIATWLEGHAQVERIHYPGLASHPGHAVAARQMKGPGGMITFDLAGGLHAARHFLGALRLFVCAESLGGVESLAEHPTLMTHASVPAETRRALGIGDGTVRLSVGLEDASDLRKDLEAGFAAAQT
jgi:cystathionine beta-lyase/cystathionine gamma-synthase/aminoglycoside phosphotransferase